jgi:hypothetical protein
VDTVLREELHISDGLADPRVIVLDPCCGTGAYVRAVLQRIAKTLNAKGDDGLTAQDLKTAALERVLGFEILPAPFVIAHLQIGLLLENLGAPLNESKDERVGVYLTNSLTGWEPPKEKPKQTIMFPELEVERDAANRVKQGKKIIVVLGNPPYNGFAGVSPEEENDLVKPYKEGLISKWGIKKFNLDDLYVRFFRMAEKRIAEHSGMGVVSFISNFSYLSDPSFVVMRQRFLEEFDKLWFDCLNGDSRETGKQTPEGNPDPSVFSTQWNREGIRVGTAIGMMVKCNIQNGSGVPPLVRTCRYHGAGRRFHLLFRQFWGTKKREELLASLSSKKFDAQYETVAPTVENRWSFRPSQVTAAYLGWPKVTDLCADSPSNGLMEKRGGALMDNDRDALAERMRVYFDKETSWESLKTSGHPLTKDAARYDAKSARQKVLEAGAFDCASLRPYALRPFDNRWCYYSTTRPLWNEPRPTLWAQCWAGNRFLLTRFKCSNDNEGVPFFFSPLLSDDHFLTPDAVAIPLRLKKDSKKTVARIAEDSGKVVQHEQNVLFQDDTTSANLSPAARAYLATLGFPAPDEDTETAEMIWMHALAIGYAPAYLTENADGIRQDWPRIPLPATKDAVLASAALGRQVAALLDTETPVPGVTCGAVRGDLKAVAACVRTDGKPINADAGDLDLTAGWGHAGKEGVTMPGRGKVETAGDALDIYLNGLTCWRNVPRPVWEYTIGGYQVIKKWLSYREKPLLGRGLTVAEVRYVTETARRIAALLALQPALDANYRAVAADSYANWPVQP